MVQKPLLEGGDGTDVSWSSKLRKDHFCQCHCCEFYLMPTSVEGYFTSKGPSFTIARANEWVYVCDDFFILFQSGQFNEDMIPTVGFNMRKVTKGNVTIKVRRI